MDVVINSLVQSPLVRTMETVASKANSFTHHIPDNCPPHSEAKITVSAREADPTTRTQLLGNTVMTYDIPAYGYLRRAVVKVTFQVTEFGGYATLYNKFGLYSLIDRIELKSRNRPIQKVYGRNQYCKDLWKGGSEFERKLHMARFKDLNTFKILDVISNKCAVTDITATTTCPAMTAGTSFYDPAATNAMLVHELPPNHTQFVVAYFEIDLASTIDLSHNYNTRFVEPIQLSVIFRPLSAVVRQLAVCLPVGVLNTGVLPLTCPPDNWDYWSQSSDQLQTTRINSGLAVSSGYVDTANPVDLVKSFKAVLLCYYLNFHDITEVDIRNANFKPEVPALIFQYDTVEEPSALVDLDTSFYQPEGPSNANGYINTSNQSVTAPFTIEAGATAVPLLNTNNAANITAANPIVGGFNVAANLSFTQSAVVGFSTLGPSIDAATYSTIGGSCVGDPSTRFGTGNARNGPNLSPTEENLNSPGIQVATKEIKITSNNLAYSVSVLCDIDEFPLHFMPTISNVTMTGSGQTIYNATGYENSLVDRLEEPLQTLQGKPDQGCGAGIFQYAQDNLIYGSVPDSANGNIHGTRISMFKTQGNVAPAVSTASTGYMTAVLPQNVLVNLSKALCRRVQKSIQNPALIRFSLSSDQTYNSGAVGLQTIANPKILVKVISNEFATTIAGKAVSVATSATTPNTTKTILPFRIFTYVNHHAIVQIDSGTGAITRSIDA